MLNFVSKEELMNRKEKKHSETGLCHMPNWMFLLFVISQCTQTYFHVSLVL